MKKVQFALFFPFLLAGCADVMGAVNPPTYDNNEYLMVAEVKRDAINAQKTCATDATMTFKLGGGSIRNRIQLYVIYSEHLPNNKKSKSMADEMQKMSAIFDMVPTTISQTYCIEKFKLLEEGSDRVLQSLGQEIR